jgi:hypothetical protein
MAPWTVGLGGGSGPTLYTGIPRPRGETGVRWKESEQDDKLTYIVQYNVHIYRKWPHGCGPDRKKMDPKVW